MALHECYQPIPRAELSADEWKGMGRVGYLGKTRDAQFADWDARFGKGMWRLAWRVGDSTLWFPNMCAAYESSFLLFFQRNPDVLDELVRVARDVYDDAPTNVNSGMDYSIQETNRTHIQDIAIRRAVRRSRRAFKGTELLQIRDAEGSHELSMVLSPGRVPFEHPAWIERPQEQGWWVSDSVEAFYQSNRHLFVSVASAAFSS